MPPQEACDRSIYLKAKLAEYAGDLDKAMPLYLKAIKMGDRTDSAVKDYAGLLHMLGRTEEALAFLETNPPLSSNYSSYDNLIEQLKASLNARDSLLPRVLVVEVPALFTDQTLAQIFPNPRRITRWVSSSHNRAVVEFSSHSAARKALLVRKCAGIRCAWAPEECLESEITSQAFELLLAHPSSPRGSLFWKKPKTLEDETDTPEEPASPSQILSTPSRTDESPVSRMDACRPDPLTITDGGEMPAWFAETPSPIRIRSFFF